MGLKNVWHARAAKEVKWMVLVLSVAWFCVGQSVASEKDPEETKTTLLPTTEPIRLPLLRELVTRRGGGAVEERGGRVTDDPRLTRNTRVSSSQTLPQVHSSTSNRVQESISNNKHDMQTRKSQGGLMADVPVSPTDTPAALSCAAANLDMRQSDEKWNINYKWFESSRLEECLEEWAGAVLPPGHSTFPPFTCSVPSSWKDSCKSAGGFVCFVTIEARFPTDLPRDASVDGKYVLDENDAEETQNTDTQGEEDGLLNPTIVGTPLTVGNPIIGDTKPRKMVIPQCISTAPACTTSPTDTEYLYTRRVLQIDEWCNNNTLGSQRCSEVKSENNCWITSQIPKSAKIIGGVFGALFVLALLLGSVFWIRKCRSNHHDEVLQRQLLRSAMRRSYRKSASGIKTPIDQSESHPLVSSCGDDSSSVPSSPAKESYEYPKTTIHGQPSVAPIVF